MSDPSSIPDLGPFVLIQAAVAAVIVGSALVAMMRGQKNKGGAHERDDEMGVRQVQMYFDGPLVAALKSLEGIERLLRENLEEQRRWGRENLNRQERIQEILRDIRGSMRRGQN